ncbi:type II toxin-antitoxin system PemK/MazF family toxin [Leptospira langatensis]|uniref:Type II toxin-antitoxin system PemK/MazF family toxin n=1 Tax=Leptospira langatensis TaxID=2484983 RepID=A0A5F1ZQK9_9LEPT|nr:type II toxin-antitoxin system PemK/MazF family toxin [Leptospira langatensis]TGL39482.1 type II toxin-antitoxin system PemK/MazF family toxin [Leptospira langatensis]
MGMVISQYEVYLINLDPTVGHEIKKSRPCLVVSPNEMNHSIGTIIIAPMTTKSRHYPTRIDLANPIQSVKVFRRNKELRRPGLIPSSSQDLCR